MPTMPRFRRYRVFLIFAVLMVVLVFRFKTSNEWSGFSPVPIEGLGKDSGKSNSAASTSAVQGTKASHDDTEHYAHGHDPPTTAPKSVVEDLGAANPKGESVALPKKAPNTKPKEPPVAIPKKDPVTKPEGAPLAASKDEPYSISEDSSSGKAKDIAAKSKDPATDDFGDSITEDIIDSTKTVPQVIIPDRKPPPHGGVGYDDKIDGLIHPVGPGRKDPIVLLPSETPVHWTKQVEQFPVPTESIIHLPTEKPIAMRKIQFDFLDETPTGKIQRELRLSQIKKEFLKAWNGYKKFAWMHDELSPKSGRFRDPFCGWAATLVDSLDTLYIMGLEDDFAEAVEAVKDIDFTTCLRADLQVFEITIRYLGGLLGAYDISGHKHKLLLDKAVELGEILMGAFDTPNRMPILFYQWKPAFSSQSHRASTRSNLAELGSLTVEFTRLAQLTKESKYYDAVARITNALVDWQKRGTKLPGVFPDEVDASGCNFTLPSIQYVEPIKTIAPEDTLGRAATMPDTVREPKPMKVADGKDDLELQIIPGQPAKGSLRKIDKEEMQGNAAKLASKRDLGTVPVAGGHTPPPESPPVDIAVTPDPVPQSPKLSNSSIETTKIVPTPTKGHNGNAQVFQNTTNKSWDCVPQGLDSASSYSDHFSMGGSQDSTYEYFPKEYMLLGGHEDKYRTMYVNTLEAVRKHMLYRPMVPEDPDILFSGKVTTSGKRYDISLEPEVTHLTCFLGGMVGMGAKLFDIEGDLEIAKKLTNGCVWAYSSMTAGVMAEMSSIFPCASVNQCTWNETLWWQHLDPSWSQRDKMIKDYDTTKAKLDAQKEIDRIATESRLEAEEKESPLPFNDAEGTGSSTKWPTDSDVTNPVHAAKLNNTSSLSTSTTPEKIQTPDPLGSMDASREAPPSAPKLHGRQLKKALPKATSDDLSYDTVKTPGSPKLPGLPKQPGLPQTHGSSKESDNQLTKNTQMLKTPDGELPRPKFPKLPDLPQIPKTEAQRTQEVLDKKKQETEEELNLTTAGREGKKSPGPQSPKIVEVIDDVDPMRPLNHTAFVQKRIKLESLKPGYLNIQSNRYILRPEAIESVWYMYRITGDTEWQEKGWKMFEAVIESTSTTYGHSAVSGVADGDLQVLDQMESFWLAETLKYFYLLYTTPDTISLDEWVLNTEAHPFRRPT